MGIEIKRYCRACGPDSDCDGDCLASLFVDEDTGDIRVVVRRE